MILETSNGFYAGLKQIASLGVDWIQLAQDEDEWQVIVSTEMTTKITLFCVVTYILVDHYQRFGEPTASIFTV